MLIKFFVFTAGSIFWAISRVMGEMNSVLGVLLHIQMGLRPDKNQKNRRQKVIRFHCWQHILAHISGHGCDK